MALIRILLSLLMASVLHAEVPVAWRLSLESEPESQRPAVPAAQEEDTGSRQSSSVRPITHEEIRSRIEESLARHFKVQGELRVQMTRAWRDFMPASNDWTFEMLQFPAGSLSNLFSVRFALMDARGTRLGEWQYTVRCERWENAYVATRQINAGESLTPADFVEQKVDTLRLSQSIVPTGTALADYQMTQAMNAGQPLYWRNVSARPLVRKGQTVDVLARKGAMMITMKARALEDGAAGATIAVRNTTSRQDFSAQVINENTVQISL